MHRFVILFPPYFPTEVTIILNLKLVSVIFVLNTFLMHVFTAFCITKSACLQALGKRQYYVILLLCNSVF